MALSEDKIRLAFKILGKVAWYAQQGGPDANRYRKVVAGTVDQAVSGLYTDNETIVKFLNPATAAMQATIRALDAVYAIGVQQAETYLRQVLAVDLGLDAGATTVDIEAALNTDMEAAGLKLATKESNASGLAAFLYDNFAMTVRQGSGPNVPDSYIDDDVT